MATRIFYADSFFVLDASGPVSHDVCTVPNGKYWIVEITAAISIRSIDKIRHVGVKVGGGYLILSHQTYNQDVQQPSSISKHILPAGTTITLEAISFNESSSEDILISVVVSGFEYDV